MKPNILHIFSDQFRYDAVHAHNNPHIKTPNLDRLVEMGVSFQKAYTPSPVCVAARCSMITGKYPGKTGCLSNDAMPEDIPTFMQILTENGYRTHGIGKCHFTPDSNALRGFQTRERQEELSPEALQNEPYYQMLQKNGFDYTYEAHGVRGPMYYIPQPSRLPAKFHPTQWIGDRAVEFIKSNQQSPWYLFASFVHPHPPFAPPVPWHKLYDPILLPEPIHTVDDESMQMFINKVQNRYKYRDAGTDFNLIRCIKAYYYACVSFVDYQIGRILQALEESGQLENTLIVFSADHGELLGDYGCFGKRSMHNSAARIPLVLYQKGVFEGGKKDVSPASLVDLAPTFLQTAEIDPEPYHLDGHSLLKERNQYVYSIFSAYQEAKRGSAEQIPWYIAQDENLCKQAFGNYMITDGTWKYIYSAPDQQEFLFRLDTDFEMHNYAGVENCRDVQERLKKKLIDFLHVQGLDKIQKDGKWVQLPVVKIPRNPDAGLITQDITCEWFDESLPGYKD